MTWFVQGGPSRQRTDIKVAILTAPGIFCIYLEVESLVKYIYVYRAVLE
jgi:hypothetical protein